MSNCRCHHHIDRTPTTSRTQQKQQFPITSTQKSSSIPGFMYMYVCMCHKMFVGPSLLRFYRFQLHRRLSARAKERTITEARASAAGARHFGARTKWFIHKPQSSARVPVISQRITYRYTIHTSKIQTTVLVRFGIGLFFDELVRRGSRKVETNEH